MIFGSVCSGIEAASAAWHFPGWRAAFLAETAAFPRAVLKHHYPDVPLHGDFTTIARGEYGPIDLLVGGTPCQDFSVAGLRAGIAGERGNLTLEFLRLAGRLRPEWVVWENVPGVLSLDGGRAFGAVLGGLGQLTLSDTAGSLKVGGGKPGQGYPAVAYTLHGADKTISTATSTDIAGSIRTKAPGSIENSSTTAVMQNMAVRRLTPLECERLQGFPDDYTLVEYRGKPAADGPRYKALGNSMAVPVMRWIGERIQLVADL